MSSPARYTHLLLLYPWQTLFNLSTKVSDALSLVDILQERRRSLHVQTEEPPALIEEKEGESSPKSESKEDTLCMHGC